jgi:hypothetical protein
MTHLSEHDLWTMGSNRVATMPPGPGDLFVVTMLSGKRVFIEPIDQYDKAVQIAERFARHIRHDRPVILRVLPMSLDELVAQMRMTRAELTAVTPPTDDDADRKLVIDTCMGALRESSDQHVRAEAVEVLTGMGVLRQ